MPIVFEVTDIFSCSPERAFKAPILGDATQFLTGYLFQPPIIGFEDDQTWGQPGGSRIPLIKGNAIIPSGPILFDEIQERRENQYWRWRICDFRATALFFLREAIGEWFVLESGPNQCKVLYRYTYYPKHRIYFPLCWLFVQIQIRGLMQKAMPGIKKQAESKQPFYYEDQP